MGAYTALSHDTSALARSLTVRAAQIQHMIKYKYIPLTLGKPKFKGKEPE
jgi:hypothetical protein